MTNWNFADVWEVIAAERPDHACLDQGRDRRSWSVVDRRADALARGLLDAGLGHQDRVAQYLYNDAPYLESVFAAFKASLVPVNTNYRYGADELAYLWGDADAAAIVYDHDFVSMVDQVRHRVPTVRLWVQVGGATVPDWAVAYEDLAGASAPQRPVRSPRGRSGDDQLFIYTGGTTGMPKGVMWRQDDLLAILNRNAELRYPEDGGLEDVRERLRAPSRHAPPRVLPGPPLMHGTALFTAMSVLTSGGSVVLPEERSFDPRATLDLIERERVGEMTIVGDAFARPLLGALDAEPDRWDTSSLWLMISSGTMWSEPVKSGLLRHIPKLIMVDALGSSEAIGIGRSRSSQGSVGGTGGFVLGGDTRVITEDGSPVEPGSGVSGLLAIRGRGPSGYHKDPEKSAATFRLLDGERWTVPGDWATVDADGTLHLLGRGSVCINTGGEKVFPEEVEEALKLHPAVADSIVVGVPDERFGEAVVAVVEPRPDATPTEPGELIAWVKGRLAGYKAPKSVLVTETIGRAANGKVDYRRWREEATAARG